MSASVGRIKPIRGETVTWGLRASDPAYDGTEIVTCDVKPATKGNIVPPPSVASVASPSLDFVAAAGGNPAHYLFTLTAAQTADLVAGSYITDARIQMASGTVVYPLPLSILLSERVTE